MLGHGCGVSQFTQFFDRIKNTNQILPRYYVECSEVEKVHLFKKKKVVVDLSKSVG